MADLVSAMDMESEIIGIRECEKLDEQMIDVNDSYDEYDDCYIVHKGGLKKGLRYTSDNNNFLSVKELRELIKD